MKGGKHQRQKNNGAAVYVGSSLTACTILSFLLTNCDGISKCDVFIGNQNESKECY